MAELITVQKYWKRWADPRWIVCVFNNQDLNEVTWEQRVMEGNPRLEASQDIPDFAYAKFGEMLGFRGIFVDSPERLASAWQEALCSDRPVVLEVRTDPDVAPLPPHLTLKEARGFMSAMAKATVPPAASSARQQSRSSTAYSARRIEIQAANAARGLRMGIGSGRAMSRPASRRRPARAPAASERQFRPGQRPQPGAGGFFSARSLSQPSSVQSG
jgi:hypothetical protein